MNKNKEYIYITRTMKINVPALHCVKMLVDKSRR